MVQLYEAYSTESFSSLLSATSMDKILPSKQTAGNAEFVPFEMAQINSAEIVPFEMAQIPVVLFSTGWTNHQIIINHCKTDDERLFYILFAKKERLQNKQLERAIRTNTMTSVLRAKESQSANLQDTYAKSPTLFKDTAYLDFLGLPRKYKESRLRKGIVEHMKEFILEMGKDFLFIDEEHPVKVGGKTYKVDLLFYHRLLQCMIAFELKTTEFRPSYQGQLEFYLEALDQEERRSNENPTIGIILCKESDMETVRFALNRSMSPMMVMQYKEQLKVGGVIQRSIEEYCKYINMDM
jgi:predicted nuclease of restriction endonuclease-like (RecB) superfamily